MKARLYALFMIMALISILSFGCGGVQENVKISGEMDTSAHHYDVGLKKVDAGNLDEAMTEFERANAISKEYPLSYTGMAIVEAIKGNGKTALRDARKGLALAKDKPEEFDARVGLIRVYTESDGKGRIKNAEKEFEKSRELDANGESLYFYMGKAYKKALDFENAEKMFRKVLDINRNYVSEADKEFKIVQQIVRSAPGTKFGRKIALVKEITRADISALFVSELDLENALRRKMERKDEPEFKTPSEFKMKSEKSEVPEDVAEHPLKEDIKVVLKLGVDGLTVSKDGKFYPDKTITKMDYALMLADLICKFDSDDSLRKKFLDSASPYNDIRSDNYAFNSIMLCVSKNIMNPKSDRTFGINDGVSGADALMAIRKLKNEFDL